MNTRPVSRRSPLTFFVLVFALSVPFWLIGAVVGQRLPLPMNLSASSLQFICPLVAALILVYREGRLGGVGELLRRVFSYRSIKPATWYLPILFLMPMIYALSYGVMRLAKLPLPQPQISVLAIPILFVVFFVTAACEEVGWTGYATDPAQARWSALKASIILGLVWAIWHVVPDIQAHRTPTWIAWHRLNTVVERILIVWLYNNTGKSLLATILFHGMDDVAVYSFPNNGSNYEPAITAPITATVAAIVTFLWGAKTLARYRFAVRL